jgi:hypothetical protein
LQRGGTQEQVIRAILSSPEYFQRAGPNDTWVNQVYRDLLGRDRDPSTQAYIDCLNAQTCNREQVANVVLVGDEYRRVVVKADYETLLRRVAADSEVDVWVQALNRGDRQEAVIAGIVTSPEYFLQAGQKH